TSTSWWPPGRSARTRRSRTRSTRSSRPPCSGASRPRRRWPRPSGRGTGCSPAEGAPITARRARGTRFIWAFLAPSLTIFLLYRILPLLWNVALSVQSWSPFKPSHFAGLIHYEELLFHDDVFWKSLWNTVVFMSSSPIAIALALGLALLVDTRIRGRGIYRAIIFISYPLMTVAVGIIWRWLYDEKVGLI